MATELMAIVLVEEEELMATELMAIVLEEELMTTELTAIVLEEELTILVVVEGGRIAMAESLRQDDLEPSGAEVFSVLIYSHTQIHFRVH